MNETKPSTIKAWLVALLLGAVTAAVYAPALTADFVEYDDPLYVTSNEWVKEGLTKDSLVSAWTERVAGNWHPITMMSHLLDVAVFGLDPSGHHATSILLHALNAMMLFGLLRSLFGGLVRPVLAAAIFALHPFNADSAVWIAERKNLVSTFFWLATTWSYIRYARRGSVGALFASIALFAIGLMSKPMLVTLPFTLLMLDVWPLQRAPATLRGAWPVWQRLLQEKIPHLLLAFGFSGITLLTQLPVGYVHNTFEVAAWMRPLYAIEHYRLYLQLFVWPEGLSVFYPHLPIPPDAVSVLLSALLLLAITAGCLVAVRRKPALLLGWLWFLGTMVPVIGLVSIGQHSIADRYMYVPMIGLAMALVWGWPQGRSTNAAKAGCALAIAALAGWTSVTVANLAHWQTSEALFERALAVTDRNAVMKGNLGRLRMMQGREEDAEMLFREALALAPDQVDTLNNMGFLYLRRGETGAALPLLEKALSLDPRHIAVRLNLARIYVQQRRFEEALRQYEAISHLDSDHAEAIQGVQSMRQRLGIPSDWMP